MRSIENTTGTEFVPLALVILPSGSAIVQKTRESGVKSVGNGLCAVACLDLTLRVESAI